jgi:uncharacterized protein
MSRIGRASGPGSGKQQRFCGSGSQPWGIRLRSGFRRSSPIPGPPISHTRPATRSHEGATLNASAADQLHLLELQAHDSRLDQLDHQRRRLPEHEQIATTSARLAELKDLLVAAETKETDIAREQAKAEADVDQVTARAARDQERLDRGQVGSPRELENLQHEIGSLARRQSDLEDVVLEIMERRESAQARTVELRSETEQRQVELAAAESRRDEQTAVIDAEAGELEEKRKALAAGLPADLLALYERLRAHSGGVGAAAIKQRRCEGCRLELGATDVQRFRNAPEDAVLRCEECGRILIRTAESGL